MEEKKKLFGRKDRKDKNAEKNAEKNAGRNGGKEPVKKSIKREIFEWIMVFVTAAALAFVVRTFIFEPVRVDGSSMLNTLTDSDFMIATKFDYLFGDPERFDIVICNYPDTDDGMYRVKRVIGMPGETVELKGGELYIDGEHVEQNFDMTDNTVNFGPFTVQEGRYFLLGDNRNNSKDSRHPLVGALPRNMIKGHVCAVVFPFDSMRIIRD